MGLLIGVAAAVVGVILLTGAVKTPDSIANNIEPHLLGVILLVAGVILAVLSVIARRRRRSVVVERRVSRGVDDDRV